MFISNMAFLNNVQSGFENPVTIVNAALTLPGPGRVSAE